MYTHLHVEARLAGYDGAATAEAATHGSSLGMF